MYNHWHHRSYFCPPRYELGLGYGAYGGYGLYNPYLLRTPLGIGDIYNPLSTEGYLGYPYANPYGLGYRGFY
jgi:hypothetical protein